jgi:hypothetical protein
MPYLKDTKEMPQIDTKAKANDARWASALAMRTGTYGHGLWLPSLGKWLGFRGRWLPEFKGEEQVEIRAPARKLRLTLRASPSYAGAAVEDRPRHIFLYRVVFEEGAVLPLGLDAQTETPQSATEKLERTDSEASRHKESVSFFRSGRRVFALDFKAGFSGLKRVSVCRLWLPNPYGTISSDADEMEETDAIAASETQGAQQIGTKIHYLAGCAIEHDFIYLAGQLDDLDPGEYAHTRMTGFHANLVGRLNENGSVHNGWSYHDVQMNIMSVCVKKKTPTWERRVCALSKEGEVEIYSGKQNRAERLEKIADAGLRLSQYKGGTTGYVTHIREIGDSLYVCGMSGQVYRRAPGLEGEWQHCDQGIFQPSQYQEPQDDDDGPIRRELRRFARGVRELLNVNEPTFEGRMRHLAKGIRILLGRDDDDDDDWEAPVNLLNCIDGNHERDIYVVGMEGVAFHFDGDKWRHLSLPTHEHLHWVRCYGPDEVYICGNDGTLLQGSARKGFRDVGGGQDNPAWWCLAKFRDKVYLSAMEGLYAWDGQNIAPVETGLELEPETWQLDVSLIGGETLWSFGAKDLVCFDGNKWQRLHDPDNPRIGE